jgi:hypothetical protein
MAKYKGIWPAPIYVARFADGTEQRASFFSAANKPIDFAVGRRMACHYARPWEAIEYETVKWSREPQATRASLDASLARYYSMPPRADLVAGHVEIDGSRIDDPHFAPAPAAVVQLPKRRKVDPIDSVLTALDKLSLSDLETIVSLVGEMIDQRLAA